MVRKSIPVLLIMCLLILLPACAPAVTPTTTAAPTATPTPEPTVNLSWYFVGSFPQPGQNEVWDAANKILLEKLNVHMDFNGLGWGDYANKMQVMIASGDEFDLCFTAGWMNSYVTNSVKGAFYELDGLLAKSPFYNALGEKFWQGAKVNGHIYAIPADQMMASPNADITINKEYLDGVGINPDTIQTMDDVGAAALAIHKKYPDVLPLIARWDQVPKGSDFFVAPRLPGSVWNFNDDHTVVNLYKTDVFKNYIANTKKWAAEGLLGGVEKVGASDVTPFKKAGQVGIWMNEGIYPGSEAAASAKWGYPVYKRALKNLDGSTEYLTSTGWSQNGMTAISATSKNPEKAFAAAILAQTDAEYLNTIVFGLEGRDYSVVSENPKTIKIAEKPQYTGTFTKAMGSPLLTYLLPGMPTDYVAQCRQINQTAKQPQDFGFVYDSSAVTAEIAKCSSVWDEYSLSFETGLYKDTDYDNFIAKLDAAGAQKIIDDCQKQYDAWLAKK